ncbi:MAG: type II toxin-antitoxin system prevent-host-death family antitoxin [Chloroflexi bacterium]|nr:type II toxin-antitoxin system prevent-host-death family antitoxin [Chloroflexota bacterium]
MARILTATETKAKLLGLLDDVAAGDEITITKHGRIVARLVPGRGPMAIKDRFRGIVTSNATDEELFSTGETWDMMR